MQMKLVGKVSLNVHIVAKNFVFAYFVFVFLTETRVNDGFKSKYAQSCKISVFKFL